MPGPTLCGVINTFPSANELMLLGCMCDGSGDEPGDSFEERLKKKIDGEFVDVSFEGFCYPEDLSQVDAEQADTDTEEGGEVYEDEREERGLYTHFCSMNQRDQSRFILKFGGQIARLIGLSSYEWMPTTEFILDAIQDELPDEILKKMATAHYLGMQFAHDKTHSEMEVIPPDSADKLSFSQQGMHDYGTKRRIELGTQLERYEANEKECRFSDSRGKVSNSRKKKCWKTERRETIRRQSEKYFGFAGGGAGFDRSVDSLERLLVEQEQSDRYEEECRRRPTLTLAEWAWMEELEENDRFARRYQSSPLFGEMLSLSFEQVRWLSEIQCYGYGFERKQRQQSELRNFMFDLRGRDPFDFDPWGCDDIRMTEFDDDRYYREEDMYHPNEPEGELERMIARFGDHTDPRHDPFSGYGESEADLDKIFPRFGSRPRFSYRFRGLSKRQQQALHR